MHSPTSPYCTCPVFTPDDYDGPQDHAAACDTCSIHGTAV